VDDEVGLVGVEGGADVADHRGDVVGAAGFREILFLGAQEVEFLARHVDGGVVEEDFPAAS
jgi:mannitol-specific phosphotransferase system IIBC component